MPHTGKGRKVTQGLLVVRRKQKVFASGFSGLDREVPTGQQDARKAGKAKLKDV